MKPVPVFGFDPADDGVVLPFLGDGFAECDRNEEPVGGAFLVDAVRNGTGGFPFFGLVEDVLCGLEMGRVGGEGGGRFGEWGGRPL